MKWSTVVLIVATALLGACSSYTHGRYTTTAAEPGPAAAANTIGVTSRPVSGAYVVGVTRWGPAHKAGVRVGDLILELDGEPVHGSPALAHRVRRARPGREIGITLL